MIKFDKTHKTFDKPINNEIGKKVKNKLILGLLISSIVVLAGCTNDNACTITGYHVNKYVTDEGFFYYKPHWHFRYTDNKFLYGDPVSGEYLMLDDYEEERKYAFAVEEYLYSIEANREIILEAISQFESESYSEIEDPITGKTIVVGIINKQILQGYKFEKNSAGKYSESEISNPYLNIDDLINDGYEFIKLPLKKNLITYEVQYEKEEEEEKEKVYTK